MAEKRKVSGWALVGLGVLLLNVPVFVPTPGREMTTAMGDLGAAATSLFIAASALVGLVLLVVGVARLIRKPR